MLYEMNLEWDLSDALSLVSLTAYNENKNYTRGDSLAVYPSVPFPVSAVAPTGIVNDPQLGPRDRLANETIYDGDNRQWSQEVRLQSDFESALNFNVGGIYLYNKLRNITYVASNSFTAYVRNRVPAAYVDPLVNPDYTGHNYFMSITEYELVSRAAFGEIYWNPIDDLRFTFGLRYTDDDKWTRGSGSTFLVAGQGATFLAPQKIRFKETTGRFNVDWSPDLPFTDDTLLYATYSKGYKAGGFNPARVTELGLRPSYEPEFVNAIEVGTKNSLLDGSLVLNLTAFTYDYAGYQIVRNVNRSIFNENVDAEISGAELDAQWEPIDNLELTASIGYLQSEITRGTTIDTYDRLQGDATYIRGGGTSGGCILNAAGVAAVLALPAGPGIMVDVACSGPATLTARLTAAGVAPTQAAAMSAQVHTYGTNVSRFSNGAGEGVIQDLTGNELPNAPSWTVSLGAQYEWDLGDWTARLRGDYYRQSESQMRYNNAAFDEIEAWDNINASLTFTKASDDLEVQLFVKNLKDEDKIVGFDIADENLGSYRTALLLDPRLYGIAVKKGF
jgi:outer membrane receptor protein involved in Fe transport